MGFNIKLDFHLPLSPAKVMDYLLDTTLIRKWSGGEATIERKEGGAVSMFGGWMTGAITKLNDHELAYTWKSDNIESEVHYKLVKDKEGTKIAVAHSNLPSQEAVDEYSEFWEEEFFGLMEEYVWTTIED